MSEQCELNIVLRIAPVEETNQYRRIYYESNIERYHVDERPRQKSRNVFNASGRDLRCMTNGDHSSGNCSGTASVKGISLAK